MKLYFDKEKAIEIFHYITDRGFDVADSMRIIYFADRLHCIAYGQPILNDDYVLSGDKYILENYFKTISEINYKRTPYLTLLSESVILTLNTVINNYDNYKDSKMDMSIENFIKEYDINIFDYAFCGSEENKVCPEWEKKRWEAQWA